MDGGLTWIAAGTLQDAVMCYAAGIGYTMDDDPRWGKAAFKADHPDIWNEARELTEEELESFSFYDDLYQKTGKRSFREQIQKMVEQGEEFPMFFAVSEY